MRASHSYQNLISCRTFVVCALKQGKGRSVCSYVAGTYFAAPASEAAGAFISQKVT